jgi:hypothetical protein
MDVILKNRHLLQREGADGGSPTAPAQDPVAVVMASAYDVEDLLDDAIQVQNHDSVSSQSRNFPLRS